MTLAGGEHAHHIAPAFDPAVASVSVVVAIVTAFLAFELAGRTLRWPEGPRGGLLTLAGVAMGGGAWAMHFLETVVSQTSGGSTYRLELVVLSAAVASAGSAIALGLVTHRLVSVRRVLASGAILALALAAMHDIGMAAVQGAGRTHVHPVGLLASLVVALLGATTAMAVVSAIVSHRTGWTGKRRLIASVVVGGSVAAMHYAGLAGASVDPTGTNVASGVASGVTLSTSALAALLTLGMSALLLIVTVDSGRQKRRAELVSDLRVIAGVSRDIGRRGDARTTVCQATHELVACDFAMVLEPDGDGSLVVRAAWGEDAPVRVSIGASGSVCASVLASGRQRFVGDLRTAGRVDAMSVERTGAVSALFEPILLDDRPIGVLVVAWRTRIGEPDGRVRSIATLLAAEAAVAIERADLVARLTEQALVDGLTGLPNRRAIDESLDASVARAARTGAPLSIAMVDVDHFKAYNDTYGHPEGDRLLAALSATWKAELRGQDTVGRYGGEEFLLLLPGVDTVVAVSVVDRLRTGIAEPVTCSFGVATWDGAETASALVNRADQALYGAKRGGRNRVVVG
jgi:diguanylate cyclase (GGDEF)-like protein